MHNARSVYVGVTRPCAVVGRIANDLSRAKACCLVREPDAVNLHVRFDEEDVETE